MDREKISVYLDKKQVESLRLLSETTRVKMAEYIREGIDLVLAKYSGELKKSRKKGG